MATLLAESTARARTVREYESKMLEMERKYQERLREEVSLPFHLFTLGNELKSLSECS
jgi:hypothetical protein